jgi:hypothetical protein
VAGNAASGPATVTLTPAATSLSDINGNAITINTLTSGTITITANSPEPSSFAPLTLLLLASFSRLRRR